MIHTWRPNPFPCAPDSLWTIFTTCQCPLHCHCHQCPLHCHCHRHRAAAALCTTVALHPSTRCPAGCARHPASSPCRWSGRCPWAASTPWGTTIGPPHLHPGQAGFLALDAGAPAFDATPTSTGRRSRTSTPWRFLFFFSILYWIWVKSGRK
jgi:hypothetical protein